MLIETISFRLFTGDSDDEYVIENTYEHQDILFSDKRTHSIEYGHMFDFEFAHKERVPQFVKFADVLEDAFSNPDNLLDISDVDEMVGCDY